jgi:hypothetical protein
MALVWPSVAWASFNGPIHFSFGVSVVFGVIGALPGAIVILLLEWKGATTRPPSWLGALAALALVYCVLRLAVLPGWSGDRGLFVLPIPPLIEFVLITFVTSPRARQAAGWAVAAASILLLALAPALAAPAVQFSKDAWGPIGGGALTTALLWQLGVRQGKRVLARPS